ncbi:hypothetical protein ACFQ9X_00960 [Catenulispora yoronensis]
MSGGDPSVLKNFSTGGGTGGFGGSAGGTGGFGSTSGGTVGGFGTGGVTLDPRALDAAESGLAATTAAEQARMAENGMGMGMPMGGMGGMGAGGQGQNKERESSTWLTEDEEVWGAASTAPGSVLGLLPDQGSRR